MTSTKEFRNQNNKMCVCVVLKIVFRLSDKIFKYFQTIADLNTYLAIMFIPCHALIK